jgi:hypothetical protein
MVSKKSIYSVHPGVLMTQKWITELKQKTGRTLEEWLAHIKKAGPKGEKERRAWLKEEYGLGTNTAWWLAERAEGKGEEAGDPIAILKLRNAMSKRCSQVARQSCGHSTTHS